MASDFFCDEFLPFGPPQKKTKENFEFFSINPTKKMLKFWKNHQTFETTKIKKKKKKTTYKMLKNNLEIGSQPSPPPPSITTNL